ncbi:uncharacterized protein EV422DRAFT_68956 [Fimicolochytrium jonesii]|uniref:uncharacterized protein n=1 Tax=Fimicolochytrium jonesii TaxID=1396493 RepID=UPI0022FEE90B|nr:uncharacterized protein EV422DRAFT_68956 [Fimicolochytrium jonesii]KAI8820396.1 hypothetical protein EV422DRAFT_68956 [Fimicolochytrium jonesii]
MLCFNSDVRRTLAPTVSHLITLISTFLDRAPTIARKRDESSVVNRLRKVYKNRLERGGGVFARTGPRREGSGREAGRVHPVRRVSAAVGSPVRRTRPEWPLPVPGAVTDGVDRDREEKAEERGPESPSSAPRSANEEDGLPSPPPPPPPAKGAAAPEVPPKTEQTAPETVADGHGNNVNGGHTAPAPAHGEDGWDEDWGSDEEDGPDAVQQTGEQPVDTTSKVESFAPAPTEAPTTPSVDDSTVIAAPTPPPPQGRGMKLGKRKDDATPPSTPPATESASNAAVPATPSTSAQPTNQNHPLHPSALPPHQQPHHLQQQQHWKSNNQKKKKTTSLT